MFLKLRVLFARQTKLMPFTSGGSSQGEKILQKDESESSTNFIQNIVEEDLKTQKFEGRVHTRFPPEPNGYLHIGHAKSICLNFGLAAQYSGKCNLRFDDTNPSKEEEEYVKAIMEDVRWLGFDWDDRLYFSSEYFDQLYEYAVRLIQKGNAYVDALSPQQIRDIGERSLSLDGTVPIEIGRSKKIWIYLSGCGLVILQKAKGSYGRKLIWRRAT